MNPVGLGAGWLKLIASSQGSGELDVLKFTTGFGRHEFDQQIHVPVEARGREGRLMYTIPGANRIGDSDPLGAGCIIPCDEGIKIVSPDNPKKNRLFLSDIQRLIARRTFVILRFFIES